MTDITSAPDARIIDVGGRRRAGWATLGAAAALALTPITVFAIPWAAINPKFAAGDDPIWRDPFATASVPWLGPVYALQGVLFAIALIAAALPPPRADRVTDGCSWAPLSLPLH